MRRVSEILLSSQDEEQIFAAARARFSSLCVLDSVPWDSAERPPVRLSLGDCGTLVSIWNPDVHPALPTDVRSNGAIYGPQVGPVIQWMRSAESPDGVLQAGRWAASVDDSDKPMISFVRGIWRVLVAHTSRELWRGVRGSTDLAPEDGFLVGADALARARAGTLDLRAGYLRLHANA